MKLRRLIFLSSLVLAVTALSPVAALGAANGSERPVKGTSVEGHKHRDRDRDRQRDRDRRRHHVEIEGTETGTTTVNLVTGASVSDGTDHVSHLGTLTAHSLLAFTITSGTTFSFTGTETDVAANGDKLFSTLTGSGTFTSTTSESTEVNTVTGGTGRFAEARGTFTYVISSVVTSTTATSETTRDTSTLEGHISF
jgi:Ni/Co efflux regulator RcnB